MHSFINVFEIYGVIIKQNKLFNYHYLKILKIPQMFCETWNYKIHFYQIKHLIVVHKVSTYLYGLNCTYILLFTYKFVLYWNIYILL
jgi:hypothetical protein